MLDKCKISDRNATGLLISFLEAIGMDASQYIINRTSIKQKREKFREDRAAEIQHRLKNTELSRLIIHWDGKNLPDITGRNFIERLPIIISAEKETKLLSIPKLENSTGRAMTDAVFDALQEYGISEFVVGLCCDTTASNTGQFNGAAVLIEQALERDLLLLPCRHHILEVVLKAVFDCQIFNSSGLNVPLFVRFRKEWDALDLTKFESGINDPIIYNILENDILDILEFAETQLTLNHDRDDYLELLKLTLIFIGVVPDNVVFRVPGAMHQARWMAKAIYSLKIFLLRSTFKLTSNEQKSLGMICVFIVKIYVKIWFMASSSIKASNCDFQLIQSIYNFQSIDKKLSSAALKKILNHSWYL
ncbi:GSCOCG00012049001-RA-CDS, partial [Cotesia congregata]